MGSRSGSPDSVRSLYRDTTKDWNRWLCQAGSSYPIFKIIYDRVPVDLRWNDVIRASDNVDIIRLLVEDGYITTDHYPGIVMNASISGNCDMLEYMLTLGADIGKGISYAVNHPDIIELIIKSGCNDFTLPICQLTSENDIKSIKTLLSYDQHVDYDEVMRHAAGQSNITIMKLAIKRGATQFNTALLYGCSVDCSTGVCKMLVSKGANNYQECLDGTDVLEYNPEVAVILLEHLIASGVDVDWIIYAIPALKNAKIIQLIAPYLTSSHVSELMIRSISYNDRLLTATLLQYDTSDRSQYMATAITHGADNVITLLLQ